MPAQLDEDKESSSTQREWQRLKQEPGEPAAVFVAREILGKQEFVAKIAFGFGDRFFFAHCMGAANLNDEDVKLLTVSVGSKYEREHVVVKFLFLSRVLCGSLDCLMGISV